MTIAPRTTRFADADPQTLTLKMLLDIWSVDATHEHGGLTQGRRAVVCAVRSLFKHVEALYPVRLTRADLDARLDAMRGDHSTSYVSQAQRGYAAFRLWCAQDGVIIPDLPLPRRGRPPGSTTGGGGQQPAIPGIDRSPMFRFAADLQEWVPDIPPLPSLLTVLWSAVRTDGSRDQPVFMFSASVGGRVLFHVRGTADVVAALRAHHAWCSTAEGVCSTYLFPHAPGSPYALAARLFKQGVAAEVALRLREGRATGQGTLDPEVAAILGGTMRPPTAPPPGPARAPVAVSSGFVVPTWFRDRQKGQKAGEPVPQSAPAPRLRTNLPWAWDEEADGPDPLDRLADAQMTPEEIEEAEQE